MEIHQLVSPVALAFGEADVTDRGGAPVFIAPLVGREVELAELVDTLDVERVITLTGSGGCGKTRGDRSARGGSRRAHRRLSGSPAPSTA
jgi:hypothetical protein